LKLDNNIFEHYKNEKLFSPKNMGVVPRRNNKVINLFISDGFDFLVDDQPRKVIGELSNQIHSQRRGLIRITKKNSMF